MLSKLRAIISGKSVHFPFRIVCVFFCFLVFLVVFFFFFFVLSYNSLVTIYLFKNYYPPWSEILGKMGEKAITILGTQGVLMRLLPFLFCLSVPHPMIGSTLWWIPNKQTYLLFSDNSPPSLISGGEFVSCPITSVYLTLIVNPKISQASAGRSTSL